MVAVQNNQLVDVLEHPETESHRVTGTTRRILHDGDGVCDIGKLADRTGGVRTDDQDEFVRARASPSTDHTLDHGNPGDRMQWFGEQRVQPGAGARGKNDESNPFGSSG
jgi:hypothetical protein